MGAVSAIFSLHMPAKSFIVQSMLALGYVALLGLYFRHDIFTRRRVPGKWHLRVTYLGVIAICLSYLVWLYLS